MQSRSPARARAAAMEFAGRCSSSAAEAGDGRRRFPEPPPQPGDAMLVIRDALLTQLQKDRLRQEIIVAELAKIERAMALRSAFSHGIAAADAELAALAFGEHFMPHSREAVGPERCVGVDEIVPPKKTSPPVKWRCAICPVEATSEGNLQQHFAGQKHRSTVIALKAKAKAKAEKSRKAMKYADKSHPTWVCKFCQANCTCKSDLENHLKGKRHQAKIQALLEESKSMAGNYVSREADLHPNIVLQDEKELAPIWNCNICQVKCPCQPVIESHLRGKKHQMNLQVLQEEAMRVRNILPQIAKNKQAAPEWGCSICQAKCNSESQFQDHRRSMGHQENIWALHKEGSNAKSSSLKTANKLHSDGSSSNGEISEKLEMQKTLYFCKLCNLQCNSKNTLAEHRRGKKHSEKVEKRRSLSYCEICNLQCNSEKMLAHHSTGKKHLNLAKLSGC